MAYTTIQLSIDSGVAIVTLNRPDKRNAVSFALVEELLKALDETEQSPAQVLILTGAGKAFCAGLDLDELKNLLGKTRDENVEDSKRMARIFRRIYDFPLPTIAAVNGAAIAGGTGFATMCDFTLAVPEAKFGYTEVRIGFVPAIVSSMLVWQVGHKIARDLLLTGRQFDATEAHRYGLVNEVVEPSLLMTRARALAAQLMENSPSSMRATKRLINGFIAGQLDSQIEQAVQDNASIRTTADFREGITSFLEKRNPLERQVSEGKNHTGAVCESRVRVRYAETDQMGVVYHANHFIWFEIGRVDLMRTLGFTYRDMERDHGCFIPVVDARCRYKGPARYDDELIVRTHLKNVRSSVIHFGYELVRAADGELLAEGETTHMIMDSKMKVSPLPANILKVFRKRRESKLTSLNLAIRKRTVFERSSHQR